MATQIFRMVAGVNFLRNSVIAEFPYPIGYSGLLCYFKDTLGSVINN